ncbi:phosphoribosyl pyrophosphate synthase-associated protein 1 isoform X1 [Egretta garzetta]|uniref:phosphoribosyl pyrophosphate synthase-associated protein 1 isoform X1 n=2 Tax=Egretta garzetta TaxID=188379 RepID=UPI00163BEAEB|nr:phosphoribosyl pyrophosphate synthase-associated protein 1 isoform X1 [Egretta garzetta]
MPRKLLLPYKSVFSHFRAPRGSHDSLAMTAARSGYRVFSANSTAACTELAKRITELQKMCDCWLSPCVTSQPVLCWGGQLRLLIELEQSCKGVSVLSLGNLWCTRKPMERCEYCCHGAADNGVCTEDFLCQEHHWGHPLLPLQQTEQNEEEGLYSLQAAGFDAGQGRFNTHYHDGPSSKGNSRLLQLPSRQPESIPFLASVYTGRSEIPDYRNAVIVAKSPDAAKRAQSYAERLRLGLAVIHGEAQCTEQDMDDGRHSPPMVKNATVHPGLELPLMMAKEKPPITVVGDVGGRIAIIVDDIIDDVESFVAAAEILKERGAYKIFVMATHGLLSADAPRLIEESSIDEVVVTNTVPHEVQKLQCPKIKTVDISLILSEAIRRIHNGESMAYLFRNITVDD